MVFLKVITKPALKDRPLFSLRASTPFGGYRKNYSRLLDMRWLQPSRIQATHIHTASYPYSYPSSQLISTRGTIVKEMRKLEEQWASEPVFPAQFPVMSDGIIVEIVIPLGCLILEFYVVVKLSFVSRLRLSRGLERIWISLLLLRRQRQDGDESCRAKKNASN